jgi:site-specific DNA-methyltransferase (adenine-specific)
MHLMQGDCLEQMKEIPDKSVNMVLTDIPYGKVNRSSNGLRNLDKGLADDTTFELNQVLQEVRRVCSGTSYIFCGTEQVSEIRAYFAENGWSTRLGIWEKTNPSPMNGQHMWLSSVECCVYAKVKGSVFNEHCKSSVWRFATARGKLHPTMKPVRLMEYLIKTSSNVGDTVLDFTMGSGTTGIACVNTNRNFIGIELDEGYFKIAKERIEQAQLTKGVT